MRVSPGGVAAKVRVTISYARYDLTALILRFIHKLTLLRVCFGLLDPSRNKFSSSNHHVRP